MAFRVLQFQMDHPLPEIGLHIIPCMSDFRRGLHWRLDLFTTLTPSRNHNLSSLLHTSVLSVLLSTSRFLVIASNSEDSSASALTSLPASYRLTTNSRLAAISHQPLSLPFTD
jgi:hypothetical protein